MGLLDCLGEWVDGKFFIEGLEYKFPEKPTLKSMRNYGLPKNKQVWSRRLDYEEFDWSGDWVVRLSENPDQLNYLSEELDRILFGEWIIIGGEPVYLNGDMYFFLQWFILHDSGEYPEFRDSSLYYYRFLEIVENTRLCTGDVLIKNRRLGATSMRMSRMLRKLLITRNKNYGITSKTGSDAEDAFGILVNAYQNLPNFLKPRMEGTSAPKKVLSLKEQASRITKGNNTAESREGLNNRALYRATGLNTFDSGAYEEIIIDESGKFPTDTPIDEYLPIVTKCVKKGARVTGKLGLPTTVNPPKAGGARFKKVWDASDQSQADYLGQTSTGLYRIMIPAYCGFDGYVGRFGESIIENPTKEQSEYMASTGLCPDPTIGAKQFQQLIRDNLKNDPEKLQEEIRMNPWNAKEVFDTATGRTYFNKKSHQDQLDIIKEELSAKGIDADKGENGRRGWFVENYGGDVKFVDDEKGLWYILQFPNEPNLYDKKEYGSKVRYTPKNTIYGAAGYDPIAHSDATVEKGSDACCIIRRRYTTHDPDNSGMPVAMFLGRMPKKSDLNKQIFLGIRFYGVRMLGERAPSDWVDWADTHGYSDYLIGTKRSDGTEVKGSNPQNKEYLEEHLTEMVESSYIDVERIKFRRLLQDRIDFDQDKRTDYDACIADGNALIALREPIKKEKKSFSGIKFISRGKIITS